MLKMKNYVFSDEFSLHVIKGFISFSWYIQDNFIYFYFLSIEVVDLNLMPLF